MHPNRTVGCDMLGTVVKGSAWGREPWLFGWYASHRPPLLLEAARSPLSLARELREGNRLQANPISTVIYKAIVDEQLWPQARAGEPHFYFKAASPSGSAEAVECHS